MDQLFNSQLQTHIQKFGRDGKKFGPPESQDPLDARLHELFIASTAYRIFDQRRKDAQEVLYELKRDEVEAISDNAKAVMMAQSQELASTAHYALFFLAKKPVTKVDTTRLRTELLKLGVSQQVIDSAWENASNQFAPARVLSCMTTHER